MNTRKASFVFNSLCYRYNDVVLPCWSAEPALRPSFDDICKMLDGLYGQGGASGYYYDSSAGSVATQSTYTNYTMPKGLLAVD